MISQQQRILVTGITSIHGWPIWNALNNVAEASRFGANRTQSPQTFGIRPPQTKAPIADNVAPLCITDRDKLAEIRDTFNPTCVVHCAGVCDLDLCEERPDWAYDLNVNGAKAVTDVFGATCKIYYMSTDLVYSGENPPDGGYAEIHTPDPVSVAGKTFYEAEQVLTQYADACIVRLGLPLGDSITGDKGAIDWIKSRLTKNRPVTLFYDELRSCVGCDQIAEMTTALLNLNPTGLYHFGGEKPWQLYEIGQYVQQKYQTAPELLKGIYRHEEQNGPPRLGDVTMNSNKLKSELAKTKIAVDNYKALDA
ncbi:MAG: SDR family oxidoreductase [Planctomycetota bacterium]